MFSGAVLIRSGKVTVADAIAQVLIEPVEHNASSPTHSPPDKTHISILLGDHVAVVELLKLAQTLLALKLLWLPADEVVLQGRH